MAVSGEIAEKWLEMAGGNARRFAKLLDSDIANLREGGGHPEGLRLAEELRQRVLAAAAEIERSPKPTEERKT